MHLYIKVWPKEYSNTGKKYISYLLGLLINHLTHKGKSFEIMKESNLP